MQEGWQQHISSHMVVNLITERLTSFMFYGLTKWHIFATIIIWLLDIDILFFFPSASELNVPKQNDADHDFKRLPSGFLEALYPLCL